MTSRYTALISPRAYGHTGNNRQVSEQSKRLFKVTDFRAAFHANSPATSGTPQSDISPLRRREIQDRISALQAEGMSAWKAAIANINAKHSTSKQ